MGGNQAPLRQNNTLIQSAKHIMQSNSDKPNESNLNHNPLLGDGEQFSKSEMAPEMMKVKKKLFSNIKFN